MKLNNLYIEGMHKVVRSKYSFSDINYIVGKNGVGKSTILQAIQLGLLGYIPGYNKNKTAIFQHCNGKIMSVKLEFDEVTITRTWSKVGSNIVSGVTIDPDGYDISRLVSDIELPVFNFSEFIGLTSNKLKDWFVSFLPNSEVEIDWDKELREFYTLDSDTYLEQTCNYINTLTSSGVDKVRDVNSYLKDSLSKLKVDFSRVQDTIQSLIYYDDVEDVMDPESIESEINELATWMRFCERYRHDVEENERIKQKLDSLDIDVSKPLEDNNDYMQLNAEYIDLENRIYKELQPIREEYKKEQDQISKEVSDIILEISKLGSNLDENGVCPYSGQSCHIITDKLVEVRKTKENLENQLDIKSNESKKLNEEISSIDKEIEERSLKLRSVSNNINEMKMKYDNYTYYTSLLKEIVEPERGVQDPSVISSMIKDLQDKLVRVKSNQRYDELVHKFTVEMSEIQKKIDSCKQWINLTGVNGLQTQSVDVFDAFIDDLNIYIQKLFGSSCRSSFDLRSKANSFSFGIIRKDEFTDEDSYIPYDILSSGEKCMFVIALFLSILTRSSAELHIILVDDLLDHLDSDNFNAIFDWIKEEKDVQIIFAGVSELKQTDGVNQIKLN